MYSTHPYFLFQMFEPLDNGVSRILYIWLDSKKCLGGHIYKSAQNRNLSSRSNLPVQFEAKQRRWRLSTGEAWTWRSPNWNQAEQAFVSISLWSHKTWKPKVFFGKFPSLESKLQSHGRWLNHWGAPACPLERNCFTSIVIVLFNFNINVNIDIKMAS